MARVLVAEDEAFTALALVDSLQAKGHAVVEAPDGEAALDLLGSFAPDILVTDLTMPRVDGAELIARMRRVLGEPIPVILITGVPQSRLPKGLEYDAYIGKPIDYDLLGRTIEKLAGEPQRAPQSAG